MWPSLTSPAQHKFECGCGGGGGGGRRRGGGLERECSEREPGIMG